MQYQPHYGYPLLGQHKLNNYAPKIQTNLIANQRNPILVVKIIGALVAFLAIGSLIYFVTL